MSEPTTVAGRALAEHFESPHLGGNYRHDILAIEAEAVAAERARIRAAVEGLRDEEWRNCPGSCHDFTVDAVIEAIQQSGADR